MMADSPRHRSSTLKPVKQPPARLNLLPDSQSAKLRSTSPPHAKFTPFASSPAPRPTSPTPTQHSGGIRAHFAHLLPRHAVFTVTLTLHQLNNVPLVHGEFGLQWKIKGVTSHSGTSLLDKVKARKTHGKLCERSRSGLTADLPTSIAHRSDTDNASLFDAASVSDAHSIANSSSAHSQSNVHFISTNGSAQGHATRTQPLPIPAVVVSANHPSSPSVTRSVSGTPSIASMSSASSMSPHLNGHFHNPLGYLSADWSRQGSTQSSMSTHDPRTHTHPPNGDSAHRPQLPAKHHYTPAKGITPFVKLKEHNVVWEKTLKFIVQMSVGRDNGELGDCLAKFVVMQRVIAGDPDAPRNPRLGVVYLNLAQYVDAGVVTRRYLLRKSKTNATLKLSIHLEHTAGELAYVAPPLPKGEILSGVAGFLESSDVYRTRPRASDLYGHTSSDSSSDDIIAASGSDTSSIVSGSGVSNGGPSHGHADVHGRHTTVKKQRRPFEISKLSTINDPRGTEKMIEALFNPVPVTQPSKVTPFTYLVEVDGEGDGDSSYGADRAAATHEDQNARPGTVALADGEGDDDSLYADSQDESVGEGDGLGSDYHSLRSHPSFQGSLRSKHSTRSLASKAEPKRDDAAEETAVDTGAPLLGGVTERRTWWRKVLGPPAAG